MSRRRDKLSTSIPGTYGYPNFGPPREYCWTTLSTETMTDNPPGMWNDFTLMRSVSSNPCITHTTPGWNENLINWAPLGFRDGATNYPVAPISGSPTNGEAATKLLALTNPSRPVVSIPNFIYELRELPQLFKNEGDTLLRRAGSANLNYHFGWAPLVGDLMKMMSFSDSVSKRTKELKALFSSGLRRKRNLFEGGGEERGSVGTNSWLLRCSHSYHAVSWERVWGYVNWYSTSPNPPETDDAMRKLARKAVLGLELDLSTAWEAIPWSWLVDWCSNVGQFLIANRNIVGASHGPIYIMRHVRGESKFSLDPQGDYLLFPEGKHEVERFRETKSRTRAYPSISAQLPFLSLRQLSILGSIGVTRRARASQ